MYPYNVHNLVFCLGGALAFVLLPSAGAQSVNTAPVARGVLEQRLKRIAGENREREQALKKLFEEAGCQQIAEPDVKGATAPNLTCTLVGTEKATVVIGAHFDKPSRGEGAIGDWTGAALLPSLFESLSSAPRRLTLVFIGFTDQQKGLRGSKAYVKELSGQDRDNIKAMVNIDCLGLDSTKIWVNHSDKNLVSGMARVANAFKLPLAGVNRDAATEVDSQPFTDKKIPTIDFHSLTDATTSVPGSDKDKAELVRMEDYANTYRLLSGYIAFLDATLGKPVAATK